MKGGGKVWFSAILACLVLGVSGVGYRYAALHLNALAKRPLLPAVALSAFPLRIGPWEGEDHPLSETTLQIAGNDDYVSRVYRKLGTDDAVSFYVSYTSQPRTMAGHRPDLCYVGAGWNLEETEERQLQTADGRDLPILVHTFRKPPPDMTRLFVVNYYLVNGRATSDYRDFSGLRLRLASLARERVDYAAQIQIASTSSTSALSFAALAAPLVELHMPKLEEKSGSKN
jgi:EpsI family protein